MNNLATKFVIWLGRTFTPKKHQPQVPTPPVEKEQQDVHYEPNVVSNDAFQARRKQKANAKHVAETEEKREDDKVNDHNPWLD